MGEEKEIVNGFDVAVAAAAAVPLP